METSTPSSTRIQPQNTQNANANPTSLLWAHQIRRENIHLLNQLDTTRSDLSSTTKTTTTLQQSLAGLSQVVQELKAENRGLRDDLRDLQGRLTEVVVSVDASMKTKRGEDSIFTGLVAGLKGRLGVLESENLKIRREMNGLQKELGETVYERVRSGVIDEVRGISEKQVEDVHRSHCCGNRQAVDISRVKSNEAGDGSSSFTNDDPDNVVVPDSMPLSSSTTAAITTHPGPTPNQNQDTGSSLQLSESTTGTMENTRVSQVFLQQQQSHLLRRSRDPVNTEGKHKTREGNEFENTSKQRDHNNPHKSGIENLQQNGKTLIEYFTFASEVRRQLPPRRREGIIVEAFIDGLDDQRLRGVLEEEMDKEGWGWGILGSLLDSVVQRQVQREQEVNRGIGEMKSGNDSSCREANNGEKEGRSNHVPNGQDQTDGNIMIPKQQKGRKRRCIPIVPVDEDDLLF